MNCVDLLGRLTSDPQTRGTVVTFNIAVDRPTKPSEEKKADFPHITVFGKQGENCAKYLRKGRMVAVHGRIETGSYIKNGQMVYTTDVVASLVEFLGASEEKHSYPAAANKIEDPDGFEQVDADVPF